jgi:putative hydrolase of the HAD superfamily
MTIPLHISWTTLLVDLDDTVYPANSGVWDAISDRMETFMLEHLNIPQEEVQSTRKTLYHTYGTTLRGLQITRHVDERAFLQFVHDVPVEDLLVPNPALRQVLQSYPQRKVIFTNADRRHADRVLRRLEIEDCFDDIIDILVIAPYCKPMPEAFAAALKLLSIEDPAECVFIDDSLKNLAGARAVGLTTIQVGGILDPDCHAGITCLSELPAVLPP